MISATIVRFRLLLTGSALFLLAFTYFSVLAAKLPVLINVDNYENFAATRYIVKHKRVPVVTADTEEIQFTELGTTRSLRPPFTFIVSAVASELTADMIDNEVTRLRMGSPIIAALTLLVVFGGFYLAFSRLGIALSGAVAIGLLPRFTLLASCNNDDIGAIFSTSVLFAAVIALGRYGSRIWVLCLLAFAFGLVLQTKYTAWLTLPWFGLYVAVLLKHEWRQLLKLSPILGLIFVLAGGWWVIFNMVNYGVADPSAMLHASRLQSELTAQLPNRLGYHSVGVGFAELLTNYDHFISRSFTSFVGSLEWLSLDVGLAVYWFYGLMLAFGLLSITTLSRQQLGRSKYVELLVLGAIIGQCLFYFHHNLVRDIQPQGRYLLPIIMLAMYLFVGALNRVPSTIASVRLGGRRFGADTVSIFVLVVVCGLLHSNVMLNHVRPLYVAKTFHTRIDAPVEYPLDTIFDFTSTAAIEFSQTRNGVTVTRIGQGRAEISMSDKFCSLLSENTLVSIELESRSAGSLTLRFDRLAVRRFGDAYWQPFNAGRATVNFSVNVKHCNNAQISLGANTHLLTILGVNLAKLKIHQYGKPI